jgi:hypothetical protein
MNDGESEAGSQRSSEKRSEAGSVAGPPPPKPEKPKETFGATGHKESGEVGLVRRSKSTCQCGKCFTCKSIV